MDNTDGAFPQVHADDGGGMTFLQYAAVHIMAGMCSDPVNMLDSDHMAVQAMYAAERLVEAWQRKDDDC